MRPLIILLLISAHISPLQGQYSQNTDTLTRKEIKRFLLQLDNEEIQIHMRKYRNRKAGGMFLTGMGSVLMTVGLIEHNKPTDPRNELAWYNGMEEIVFGGLMTLAGIIIWEESNLKYKEAKNIYIKESGTRFIRDEQDFIYSQ